MKSIDMNMLDVHDLQGAWVTPGLVDLHSHIGVESAPSLGGRRTFQNVIYNLSSLLKVVSGAVDGNSHKGPILPWLRSIDGLNTHDDAYNLSIAGGVTTAQVLPGSANNIGTTFQPLSFSFSHSHHFFIRWSGFRYQTALNA